MSKSTPAASSGAASSGASSKKAPLLWNVLDDVHLWFYQTPAKNKKETGMLGYINKREGGIENVSFQFGDVDAWLLEATGKKDQIPEGHFVCTFPFGISDPYDKTKVGIAKRLNLQCSFKSPKAVEILERLEANHVEQNVIHAKEWFPKMFELNKKEIAKLVNDANRDEDKETKKRIKAIKDEDAQAAAQKEFEVTLIQRNAEDQIRSKWKSNLTENEKYGYQWRAKINIESSADGPAVEVIRLSLQNGKPVMSKGSPKDITKFSRGIPIMEQTPGQWYQTKEYGCSYTIPKILLIPAPPKAANDFDLGGIEFGVASGPIDEEQFKGRDPDQEEDGDGQAAAAGGSAARKSNSPSSAQKRRRDSNADADNSDFVSDMSTSSKRVKTEAGAQDTTITQVVKEEPVDEGEEEEGEEEEEEGEEEEA
jgi:hypothetical protein